MKIPLLHKQNPTRMIWIDVCEPLPPVYFYPFPDDTIDIKKPHVSMNGTTIRIAEFELGKLVTCPNSDGIPCYAFKGWN